MTALHVTGDTRTVTRNIPDNAVDLIVTSPPFIAQRTYLPDGHPAKHAEIGAEATPAAWLDTMLRLTADWGRVLAPHGSLCVEIGDTYSSSGGRGPSAAGTTAFPWKNRGWATETRNGSSRAASGAGWPLNKSLAMCPEAYRFALVYGINPFTGEPSPAGQWRARNVIRWARANPSPGDDGDRHRVATTEMVVLCRNQSRFYDKTVGRRNYNPERTTETNFNRASDTGDAPSFGKVDPGQSGVQHPDGAPRLDWVCEIEEVVYRTLNGGGNARDTAKNVRALLDAHAGRSDLWVLSSRRHPGAHTATFTPELVVDPVQMMCPEQVCRACGTPRERIEHVDGYVDKGGKPLNPADHETGHEERRFTGAGVDNGGLRMSRTVGWTDCGCKAGWRPGIVFDPFAGTGTVAQVATGHGRAAFGVDIDERNEPMFLDRVGPMFGETTSDPERVAQWFATAAPHTRNDRAA